MVEMVTGVGMGGIADGVDEQMNGYQFYQLRTMSKFIREPKNDEWKLFIM